MLLIPSATLNQKNQRKWIMNSQSDTSYSVLVPLLNVCECHQNVYHLTIQFKQVCDNPATQLLHLSCRENVSRMKINGNLYIILLIYIIIQLLFQTSLWSTNSSIILTSVSIS